MDREEFELIIGLLCLLISIFWGYSEIKEWNKTDKDDYMLKSSSIKILSGLIIFFLIGIIGIYRYLS